MPLSEGTGKCYFCTFGNFICRFINFPGINIIKTKAAVFKNIIRNSPYNNFINIVCFVNMHLQLKTRITKKL